MNLCAAWAQPKTHLGQRSASGGARALPVAAGCRGQTRAWAKALREAVCTEPVVLHLEELPKALASPADSRRLSLRHF